MNCRGSNFRPPGRSSWEAVWVEAIFSRFFPFPTFFFTFFGSFQVVRALVLVVWVFAFPKRCKTHMWAPWTPWRLGVGEGGPVEGKGSRPKKKTWPEQQIWPKKQLTSPEKHVAQVTPCLKNVLSATKLAQVATGQQNVASA